MRSIWFKIHWFLGVFFSLLLTVIALSGAMLSFEKEIMYALNKTTLYADEVSESILPSKVFTYVQKAYPTATITAISFFSDGLVPLVKLIPNAEKSREALQYTVNPANGTLSPLVGEPFFNLMMDIHRRCMMGSVGKELVALSTIALLLLVILGVYLYWGRLKRHFLDSFKIDFKKRGRGFLYQLHSAIGMWMLPWYLLLCFTGLYWSYDWYKNTLHVLANVPMPTKQTKKMPKNSPLPLSLEKVDQAWLHFKQEVPSFRSATILLASMESQIQINYFDDHTAHHGAKNSVKIDTHTMQTLLHEYYHDQPFASKVLRSIRALHSGEFFGWIGRLSIFIAAVSMLLFVVTGWMLYIKRGYTKNSILSKKGDKR